MQSHCAFLCRKCLGSGDPHGLQNRWSLLTGDGVFDSHALPPCSWGWRPIHHARAWPRREGGTRVFPPDRRPNADFFEHGAVNLGDSRTLVDGTKLSGWAFDGCAKLQGNASRGSTHSRITGSIGSTHHTVKSFGTSHQKHRPTTCSIANRAGTRAQVCVLVFAPKLRSQTS
jgi:hypothetical protein